MAKDAKNKSKGPAKPAAKSSKPAKPAKAAEPKAKVAATLVKKKPAAAPKNGKPVSVRVTREPLKAKAAEKPVGKPSAKHPEKVVVKLPASFINLQRQRLLQLKDNMVDSMAGVASETLRSRAQDSEASAFGMHQADAGSDAYDRDFALNLLSQEQDALYEIEEALKRIEGGTYGVCEMSGRSIPIPRLEAIPFARFTVEIQSQVEKEYANGVPRRAIRSLFGLGTDEDEEDGDEESVDEKES